MIEDTSAHLWKNWRKMLLKEEAIPSPASTAMAPTPQQPTQQVIQPAQKVDPRISRIDEDIRKLKLQLLPLQEKLAKLENQKAKILPK